MCGFLSTGRAALLAALLVSGMLYGCSSDKGREASTSGPQSAKAAQGKPDKPDLAKGKEVYEQHCHFCHGYKGYGDGPVGIALTPHPANFVEDTKRMSKTDEELNKTITEGIHRDIGGDTMSMPRWNEVLTDHERWNVLWYIKMGIVQVMEGRRLFEHLTVEENLWVGAYARNDKEAIRNDLDLDYHYFPRLKDLRKNVSGYLSGGERQMLVMGRALKSHPKLMLLDEPSLGLSPLLVKDIFDVIKKINREEKTSILLVEQNANIALSTSDFGYIMENGRVVLDGPSPKLKENEDIKEFYLGLSQVGKRKSFREVKQYRRRKRWLS